MITSSPTTHIQLQPHAHHQVQQPPPSPHHPYPYPPQLRYNTTNNNINNKYSFCFEREDAVRESMLRSRHRGGDAGNQSSFSYLRAVKLNKGKQFLLAEERNTEIQRSNRILHEKLAKCARRSQPTALKSSTHSITRNQSQQPTNSTTKPNPKSKKSKTSPTLPLIPLQPHPHNLNNSRNNLNNSRNKSTQKHRPPMTLFMGHSKIDGVEFKIKIVISEQVYYLIAENQHTRIVLQMEEEEYWGLHYGDLEENPCHIFRYLEIQKGQIRFRVQDKVGKSRARHGWDQLPNGIKKRKHSQKFPKI